MSSTNPGRRRPRKAGGRSRAVYVRLTDQESEIISARARAAGVSVPWFLVDAALDPRQSVAERRALIEELLSTRRLVGRVSNNLNQLTRVANATGEVPQEANAALEAVARVLTNLNETAAAIRNSGSQRLR